MPFTPLPDFATEVKQVCHRGKEVGTIFIFKNDIFYGINKLSEQILKYAFKLHTEPGPGLLESSYKECLYYVLNKNGIYTMKESPSTNI